MKFQMTVSLLIAVIFFSALTLQFDMDRVPACDEVCGRSQPEQFECCRAHGYARGGTCSSWTKILCLH